MERRAMKQRYIMTGAHKEMRGLEYLVYSAFSLVLLVVLVFLPLAPVFADEVISEDESSTSPDVQVEEVESSLTEVIDVVDEVPEIVTTEGNVPLAPPEISVVTGEITEPEVTISDSIPPEAEVTDETVIVETASSSTEALVEEVVVAPSSEVGSTTDELPESEIPTEETPSLEEVVPETESVIEETPVVIENVPTTTTQIPVVNFVTNDENKFSFSKDECTTVGDGTFYCATAKETPTLLNTDRIFSAVDAEGDKEIYVEKNNELNAITNNQFDDDAPYFDEVSNTAVWHRLMNGRYQIIQFDFETGEETQLTDDRYNNMQPSVFGAAVVWQGWVGNDWEIFYETDGERTMLTDNNTHDIAPSVNGTHIVWQSFEGDAWRMQVYDMRSGVIDTIEDADGGSIENPRFVLVYDAKMDTGDIETRGYDLKSGEVLNLASRPTPVPEEIPNPEQTGEERALVAPSTQPKPKTDSDENDDVGTTTDNGLDEGDLVIPALIDGVSSTSTSEAVIDSSDVIIPSFNEGTTTTETVIEDLVVEPYVSFEDIQTEEVLN